MEAPDANADALSVKVVKRAAKLAVTYAADPVRRGANILKLVRGGCSRRGRRLFTMTLVDENESQTIHAFGATMAASDEDAREWLRRRWGAGQAHLACLRDGFDSSLPLVEAMVAPAIGDMLKQVAAKPDSVLADGLEVSIEQRFAP